MENLVNFVPSQQVLSADLSNIELYAQPPIARNAVPDTLSLTRALMLRNLTIKENEAAGLTFQYDPAASFDHLNRTDDCFYRKKKCPIACRTTLKFMFYVKRNGFLI